MHKTHVTDISLFWYEAVAKPLFFPVNAADAPQRQLCKKLQDSQIPSLSCLKVSARLLPLAQLAAWWLLLICPWANVSTSPIWTRIKGPNANSCAEISHVSIYSYFVMQRATHSAQIMNSDIWISSSVWVAIRAILKSTVRIYDTIKRWVEKWRGEGLLERYLWRRTMAGTLTEVCRWGETAEHLEAATSFVSPKCKLWMWGWRRNEGRLRKLMGEVVNWERKCMQCRDVDG